MSIYLSVNLSNLYLYLHIVIYIYIDCSYHQSYKRKAQYAEDGDDGAENCACLYLVSIYPCPLYLYLVIDRYRETYM